MSVIEMLKIIKKNDKVIVKLPDNDVYEGILIKKGKYEVVIKYNYYCGWFVEDITTISLMRIISIIKMPADHITKYKMCKVCNNKIKFHGEGCMPGRCENINI